MNKRELKMLDLLKQMRDEDDIIAVKAEFEAEGSRDDELVMLNQIIFRADMELYIKIGGCEAVTDLNRCKKLGAAGIMAPMTETPFAMQKFIGAADKVFGDGRDEIEWIINAETRTCHENLDAILEKGKGFLRTVSIGRVDLSGSMGLTGQFDHPDFVNVMDQINAVCAKRHARMGLHIVQPDPAELKRQIAIGARFIAYGIDTVFLWKSSERPAV